MKKKTAFGLILGAAAAVTLPVFLAAPGRAGKAQKAPFLGWNFAHRGLHRADKSVPGEARFVVAAEPQRLRTPAPSHGYLAETWQKCGKNEVGLGVCPHAVPHMVSKFQSACQYYRK